jgi:hypothetical protein
MLASVLCGLVCLSGLLWGVIAENKTGRRGYELTPEDKELGGKSS